MKDVVLVHGLWVPALVMSPLALVLVRAGFRCHRFGYPGRTQPLAKHAERLAAQLGLNDAEPSADAVEPRPAVAAE